MRKYYCDRCGKEVGSLYKIHIRYPTSMDEISFNKGEFCEKCYILMREQIDWVMNKGAV